MKTYTEKCNEGIIIPEIVTVQKFFLCFAVKVILELICIFLF